MKDFRPYRLCWAILGIVCMVGWVACEEDSPSATSAPNAPNIPPSAKKKKTGALDAGAGDNGLGYQYAFNPNGKRDPFVALEPDAPAENESIRSMCDDVLCQWDLDQLKLVAVVSGDSNPMAMVEDPTGVGHIVRRNSILGRKAGKVTQILNDCIVVVEYWKAPDGKVNANPLKVCIKDDKSAEPAVDLRQKGKEN